MLTTTSKLNGRHKSPAERTPPSLAGARVLPELATLIPHERERPSAVRRKLVIQWRSRFFPKVVVKVAHLSLVVLPFIRVPAAVQMESLTAPDGSLPMGSAGALSTDGSALTGSRWALDDYLPEVFRWVAGTNVMEITPGAVSAHPNAYLSQGTGIADNGRVVVGWEHEGQPGAFAWANGAALPLAANRGSRALGVSRDGTIAVGRNPTTTAATSVEAVSWSLGSGTATILPDLAGGPTLALAQAISADKSTIVGWGTDATGRQACRWSGGAVSALGDLPGGKVFSEAAAVSGDGTVIVGRSWSSAGIEAFRWSAETGLQGLGDLPGGCTQSEATGISDDGQLMVGIGHSDLGAEVLVWNPTNGMRSLRTLMKAAGQDISGWQFSSTRPVLSGDGNVLAGEAVNPDQDAVLFRVSGLREMTGGLVTTWMAWRREAPELIFRFSTEPGLRYQAQGAPSMSAATWSPVGEAVLGTGAEQEIRCTPPGTADRQFYRLLISP